MFWYGGLVGCHHSAHLIPTFLGECYTKHILMSRSKCGSCVLSFNMQLFPAFPADRQSSNPQLPHSLCSLHPGKPETHASLNDRRPTNPSCQNIAASPALCSLHPIMPAPPASLRWCLCSLPQKSLKQLHHEKVGTRPNHHARTSQLPRFELHHLHH